MGLGEGDFVRIRLIRIDNPEPDGGWPRYRCRDFEGETYEYEVRSKGSRFAIYSEDGGPMGDFADMASAMSFLEAAYPDSERLNRRTTSDPDAD